MAEIIDFKTIPKKRFGGYPNEISQSINEKLKDYDPLKESKQRENYHNSVPFDVKRIYIKLIIPNDVSKRDIIVKGTYNGKKKRNGTEYYDGFYFNREEEKIYKVETPWSALNKVHSGRGYIGSSISNLLNYYFQVYNHHISNAIYNREYEHLNRLIVKKNTIIYEALSYGMDRGKLIALLEETKGRSNAEFGEY